MERLERVLIANRGEIAVRIIKACRSLGLKPVLAVSEADRESLGARLAERTICIGPPPAHASYLKPDAIVAAALGTGCQAVHPGYGFLAENAAFAEACAEKGLIFVGPSPATIAQVGDKLAARQMAKEANLPTIPGSSAIGSPDEAETLAAKMGYPVILKAAGGGGGRGMFVAQGPDDLGRRFENASGEANAAFGDGTLYMERYIPNARHIEVQILADRHGNVVDLGERDCSAQRRYQKVVEEAPAPDLPETIRQELRDAAVRLARHIDYQNAGTVEFLYDAGSHAFFFIEMNARVQVEHPVSEMVTGVDIVQEQLRIADGAALSVETAAVETVGLSGHAIECRINAESPDDGFAPQPGRITLWRPPEGDGIRLDSHLQSGDDVPPFYDSMIGKLIVHGTDRAQAIARMADALARFEVEGIKTNIPLQRFLIGHEDFARGAINIRWLEDVLLPAYQTRAV